MSIRAVLLFCSIAGVIYAQESSTSQDQGSAQQTPAGTGASQPVQANANAATNGQKKDAQANHQKHGKSTKDRTTNQVPATPSSPATVTAGPPSGSPAQKLLDALDAAIRQQVNGAPRPGLSSFVDKESELQKRLTANGDPAQISREAAETLVLLYTQPSRVITDDKRPVSGDRDASSSPMLIIVILVALISPLICVAGFWWAGKLAENALRKGLREAGLL